MNKTILQILKDFSLEDYEPIFPRTLDLGEPLVPRRGNLVKVVVGMRRSGKSYRLLQEMKALHAKGIPWERMCYFNFEDDRLGAVTPQTGDEVIEAFLSMRPASFEEGCYFFFDEIQEMKAWGSWMRRLVDTTKATFYLSGSSSRLLSDEIGTEFRGRAIEFELLPLSFREYLTFRDEPAVLPETTVAKAALSSLFASYLETGGFPDAISLSPPHRITLLQSYVDRVVSKDVVERHGIENSLAATFAGRRLLELNGCALSLRKMEGQLRSEGIVVARATLKRIVDHFTSAYLAFTVEERRTETKASEKRTKKVYAIDPGLALASSHAGSNNFGQRLEDAVYLELRRRSVGLRDNTVGSFRTAAHRREVDFLVGDKALGQAPLLIQVCASLESETTRARELRALAEASRETGIEQRLVIVGEGPSETIEYDGMAIRVVNIVEWLLND